MANQLTVERFIKNHTLMIEEVIQALTVPVEKSILSDQLKYLSIASDYALEQLHTKPYMLEDLIKSGDFYNTYTDSSYNKKLREKSANADDYAGLEKTLRAFRHREMIRIIWRDVFGYTKLKETLHDLSNLADACVLQSIEKLQIWLEKKYGTPVGHSGDRQTLHTIAMGKLGGRELNFSSDIDLIFCYADKGFIEVGEAKISNQEFFVRLAEQLMALLGRTTEGGFVFRVDMRLRPYGNSGSLVTSLSTLKQYLNDNAFDWERYAFVKSRVVTASDDFKEKLNSTLQQFIFQSDEDIVSQLKATKQRLCRFQQTGLGENIKTGRGGIRAAEFIVQTFQLIQGRNDADLCESNLMAVLEVLKEKRYLKPATADRLNEAYCFLRMVENRLQMFADQHTHSLPRDALIRKRLAKTLGFVGWQHLVSRLNKKRKFVAELFDMFVEKRLIACVDELSAQEVFNYGRQRSLISDLSRWRKKLLPGARRVVPLKSWQAFVIQALNFISYRPPAKSAIQRLLRLLDVLARASKLALLTDDGVCKRLMKLCVTSDWVIDQLTHHENLLVELLTASAIYLPPYLKEMQAALEAYIKAHPADSFDEFVAVLVSFKQHYLMRVVMADVLDQLPIMRVSDALTDITIAILRQLRRVLWEQMVNEYGYPSDKSGGRCKNNFIIVAYGKLGGIELGYSSDLDLIFLHDADANAMTDGESAIGGFQFYTRLTQRLIKALSQQTSYGKLYEIDTRLKPLGESGMLVNSIDQFEEYQRNSAWTWEHQALVRARAIAGDPRLGEKFKSIRQSILSAPRDIEKIRQDIVAMREKMHEEKPPVPGKFHLKRDPGGITDIEFMAQFIVLAWSQHQNALLLFPDNIRIFETCESAALMPRVEVDALCEAYRRMREKRHHLWLRGRPGIVDASQFVLERKKVRQAFEKLR